MRQGNDFATTDHTSRTFHHNLRDASFDNRSGDMGYVTFVTCLFP